MIDYPYFLGNSGLQCSMTKSYQRQEGPIMTADQQIIHDHDESLNENTDKYSVILRSFRDEEILGIESGMSISYSGQRSPIINAPVKMMNCLSANAGKLLDQSRARGTAGFSRAWPILNNSWEVIYGFKLSSTTQILCRLTGHVQKGQDRDGRKKDYSLERRKRPFICAHLQLRYFGATQFQNQSYILWWKWLRGRQIQFAPYMYYVILGEMQ